MGFPMVIHRGHFSKFRAYLVSYLDRDVNATHKQRVPSWQPGEKFHFTDLPREPGGALISWERRVAAAFARLIHNCADGGELVGLQTSLGTFLWHFKRTSYVWSFQGAPVQTQLGVSLHIPPEHTCPRLRAAQHLPYWGWGQNNYQLRLHGGSALAADGYVLRAEQLIMAGLCAVPWRQRERLTEPDISSSEHRAVPNTSDLDPGWLVVRHEMCGDGWRRGEQSPVAINGAQPARFQVLRADFSEERLLASYFPEQLWTDAEADFCNELKPSVLVRDYMALMGRLFYLVDVG